MAPSELGRAVPALLSLRRATTSAAAPIQAPAKASRALIWLKADGVTELTHLPEQTRIQPSPVHPWTGILLSSLRRGSLCQAGSDLPLRQLFRRCCSTETKLSALPPFCQDRGGQHLSLTGTPQSTVPTKEPGTLTGQGTMSPCCRPLHEDQRRRDMMPSASPLPPAALTHGTQGTKPARHGPCDPAPASPLSPQPASPA